MSIKMHKEFLSIVKVYIGYLFDIVLFTIAAWDEIDRGLRTVSALGAIIVLVFIIRKHLQEHSLKKLEIEIKKMEAEKLRREMIKKNKRATKNKPR